MGVALVGPGRPMDIGAGRIALWCPNRGGTQQSNSGSPIPATIGGLTGGWDASSRDGVLTNTGVQPATWNTAFGSVTDKSSNAAPLVPFSVAGNVTPVITPRLSGFMGGAGRTVGTTGAVCPDLHPDLGYQIQRDVF